MADVYFGPYPLITLENSSDPCRFTRVFVSTCFRMDAQDGIKALDSLQRAT
jgi:hypothetical protein